MRWFTILMLISVLKAILTKMFDVLILLILVTDSKSLYDCLVKLNIIVKKRLMMNVMTLRQNYERREITEVRWISEDHNSVDALIKFKASNALKKVIDINQIRLNSVKWVERINQSNYQKDEMIKQWDESDWSSQWVRKRMFHHFSEMLQCWYNHIICS